MQDTVMQFGDIQAPNLQGLQTRWDNKDLTNIGQPISDCAFELPGMAAGQNKFTQSSKDKRS